MEWELNCMKQRLSSSIPILFLCIDSVVMSAGGLHLVPAGAPEVVRSNQKDRFYSNHISSLISDISQRILPMHYWLRWERELQLLAEIWYYGLTTVWGSQTLGEEYCNIVQVGPQQSHKSSAPSLLRRTLAISAQLLGPYALEKLLGRLSRRVENRNLPLQLSSRQYRMLENVLALAEDLVSTAGRLHLALFYIQGVFYQLGKRITRIRYLAIRYGLTNNTQTSALNTYRLLGWLVVVQVVLKLLTWSWRLYKCRENYSQQQEMKANKRESNDGGLIFTVTHDSRQVSHMNSESVQLKCPLCLEVCCDITATPCGHLFCWQCVAEWTSERSECPVCRANVEPQTLVALQHFAL